MDLYFNENLLFCGKTANGIRLSADFTFFGFSLLFNKVLVPISVSRHL